eukprot:m.97531 g.97531  ORF g.97531 m.97531 type:complete len:539 (-) comp15226_c0_seq3:24-1640(-)
MVPAQRDEYLRDLQRQIQDNERRRSLELERLRAEDERMLAAQYHRTSASGPGVGPRARGSHKAGGSTRLPAIKPKLVGDSKKALGGLIRTLESCQAEDGASHSVAVADAAWQVAVGYRNLRDSAAAVPYFELAARNYAASLGFSATATLKAFASLAHALMASDEPVPAARACVQVLHNAETGLGIMADQDGFAATADAGKPNLAVVHVVSDVGNMLMKLCRYALAMQCFEKAGRAAQQAHGLHHELTQQLLQAFLAAKQLVETHDTNDDDLFGAPISAEDGSVDQEHDKHGPEDGGAVGTQDDGSGGHAQGSSVSDRAGVTAEPAAVSPAHRGQRQTRQKPQGSSPRSRIPTISKTQRTSPSKVKGRRKEQPLGATQSRVKLPPVGSSSKAAPTRRSHNGGHDHGHGHDHDYDHGHDHGHDHDQDHDHDHDGHGHHHHHDEHEHKRRDYRHNARPARLRTAKRGVPPVRKSKHSCANCNHKEELPTFTPQLNHHRNKQQPLKKADFGPLPPLAEKPRIEFDVTQEPSGFQLSALLKLQ